MEGCQGSLHQCKRSRRSCERLILYDCQRGWRTIALYHAVASAESTHEATEVARVAAQPGKRSRDDPGVRASFRLESRDSRLSATDCGLAGRSPLGQRKTDPAVPPFG
jgi:hypothetical protein